MPSISSFIRDRHIKRSQSFVGNTQVTRVGRRSCLPLPKSGRFNETGSETASVENTPASPGPSYGLTTNAPERPSLPIYESFTSTRDFGYLGQNERDVGPNGGHTLRRVASIPDLRARSARDGVVTPTPRKAPVYGRSAALAKLYQSVMPDFDTMFAGDDDNTTKNEKEKQQSTAQCQQDNIDSDTTLPPLLKEKSERRKIRVLGANIVPTLDQARSDSSITSVTVVESNDLLPPFKEKSAKRKTRALGTHLLPPLDQTQPDSLITTLPLIESNDFGDDPTDHAAAQADKASPRPRSRSSPWPFGVALSTPDASSEADTRDVAPVSTIPTRGRAVSELQAQRRRRYLLGERGSIVLHVCTEKLVEQLTEAFVLQRRGGNAGVRNGDRKEVEKPNAGLKASLTQMQLMLMIEAYEGVLKSCRREMVLSQLWQSAVEVDGSGATGQSKNAEVDASREAVPILEHWLATLTVMYEGLAKRNGSV